MAKTVAIMQPYFLPYIGYWQLIAAVDEFVLYDDVNYINKGWINRNNILLNGQKHLITIPLQNASQNKLINEIELSNDPKWSLKILKTIEQAYRKAPFYAETEPILTKTTNYNPSTISNYIYLSIKQIAAHLNITTNIIESSSVYQNSHLKAQDRILDICKKTQASHYINPIGGMELYDKGSFLTQNIKLSFLQTKPIHYPQFGNEFVSNLSILDILMFNPKSKIEEFLSEYTLV
jgi:hypothetical protein